LFISCCIGFFLIAGFLAGFGIRIKNKILGNLIIFCYVVFIIYNIITLLFGGISIKKLHRKTEKLFIKLFLKKESSITGIDLEKEL